MASYAILYSYLISLKRASIWLQTNSSTWPILFEISYYNLETKLFKSNLSSLLKLSIALKLG